MKTLLHVGCGPKRKEHTTPVFNSADWTEIRLDIDRSVSPDVVASITDLSPIPAASVDAVFSSHNIEHLAAHEVPHALAEMRRVLRPGGHLALCCPDLKTAARLIVEDRLGEPAYHSALGPVTPLDILYGMGSAIRAGNTFMAHRCGFTQKTLLAALRAAGFETVAGTEIPGLFELWAVAAPIKRPRAELNALLVAHLEGRAKPVPASKPKGSAAVA